MLKQITSTIVSLLLASTLTACAAGKPLPVQVSKKMQTATDKCLYWQSEVDESVKLPHGYQEPGEKDERTIMNGIECLLNSEGNKNKAKFSGATHAYVSQLFEPATVEVAALYYISYLYLQKWDHADAIDLANDNEGADQAETTRRAYKAYRAWYKKVKKIGIVKAREKHLNPLQGTGIRWY
jgi:hypothetical protein